MTRWRGVLFDLDGTLADTLDLILRSFRYTMRRHLGTEPRTDAFLASLGKPLPVQLRDYARSEPERLAEVTDGEHIEMGSVVVIVHRPGHLDGLSM